MQNIFPNTGDEVINYYLEWYNRRISSLEEKVEALESTLEDLLDPPLGGVLTASISSHQAYEMDLAAMVKQAIYQILRPKSHTEIEEIEEHSTREKERLLNQIRQNLVETREQRKDEKTKTKHYVKSNKLAEALQFVITQLEDEKSYPSASISPLQIIQGEEAERLNVGNIAFARFANLLIPHYVNKIKNGNQPT